MCTSVFVHFSGVQKEIWGCFASNARLVDAALSHNNCGTDGIA